MSPLEIGLISPPPPCPLCSWFDPVWHCATKLRSSIPVVHCAVKQWTRVFVEQPLTAEMHLFHSIKLVENIWTANDLSYFLVNFNSLKYLSNLCLPIYRLICLCISDICVSQKTQIEVLTFKSKHSKSHLTQRGKNIDSFDVGIGKISDQRTDSLQNIIILRALITKTFSLIGYQIILVFDR